MSASADGRCPECGLRFTHAALKRHWVARKQAKRKAWGDLSRLVGGAAAFLFSAAFVVSSAAGSVAMIVLWTLVAAAWAAIHRERLAARSHYFLGFIVPLVILMPVVAATPYGLYSCAVLGLLCCAAAWLALRWSPLISATLLLCAGVLPLMVFAGAIFVASAADVTAGRYWSSFSQPTPHGWRALPSWQSQRVAYGVAGVAVAVGLVVSLYTRRALVRLRARSGAGSPNPAPLG